MEFEQIKKRLKDGYEQNGFDVVSEPPDGEAILRYPTPATYDVTLKIDRDDIKEYGALLAARSEFETVGKTGIANTNFRESLLIPLDPAIDSRDIDDIFFRLDSESKTYVEIDTVSLVFANYFRFDPGYINLCLDRLYALSNRFRKASQQEAIDIRQLFAHPLSIRVYDIGADSVDEAIHLSDELINGALFTLAYDIGIPLMLASEWPRSRFEYAEKIRTNSHKMNQVLVPNGNFRYDLVRYYQAGLASPIAVQQFLSFYQILELFFQDVEHVGVYDELYHMLRSDDFKPDNSTLARIVTMVEAHKRELTNVDLLEQLLRQHVDAQAIKQFIVTHGGRAEETIHTLASRIIATRDVIMMAGVNGLPPDDESVAKDVPLVKFLAEQVILASRT